ncbi:MAG: hypothetical protein KDB53_18705 [Planctomycetes bacterium]|nr:hypothetical protein [Planctomycetota bacterium]
MKKPQAQTTEAHDAHRRLAGLCRDFWTRTSPPGPAEARLDRLICEFIDSLDSGEALELVRFVEESAYGRSDRRGFRDHLRRRRVLNRLLPKWTQLRAQLDEGLEDDDHQGYREIS